MLVLSLQSKKGKLYSQMWPRSGRDKTGVRGSLGPWVQVERFVVPRHVALGTNVSLECDYQVQQHATLYSLKWYKGSSQFYQYIPSKTEPHAVFSVPGLHQNQLVGYNSTCLYQCSHSRSHDN
ncbi:hypothetical protein Pcinc_015959 [Petrolisthes cinctipes]|uniref:Ig-like domain-containing protein n=1 Tax=Petrolisthes cinctipes TaxID=88211 RepID=A0AAE1KQ77_PETCI|nr:hypothetical protein Pcinc_015959 [Petrolisthes cinctipes]